MRSKPKPIKRALRGAEPAAFVSQSLPANYYSSRCPRAPLPRPIEARIKPPSLNLPPSPADFQDDYSGVSKKTNQISFSLKKYSGPTVSASMPTWNPHRDRLLGKIKPARTSRGLPPIPASPSRSSDLEPRSVTAFCILSEDCKETPFPTKSQSKPLDEKTPARDQMKPIADLDVGEAEGSDGDVDVTELQEDMFEMDL